MKADDIKNNGNNNIDSLSQWQLMWLAFKRHKLAMFACLILFIFYLIAIFSGFFAPNLPHNRNSKYIYAPPQLPRFFDNKGNFYFRPFVYGLKFETDPVTWERKYVINKEQKNMIYFFVKREGKEYKILSLLKSNIHFFDTKQNTSFYLFGSDNLGRDVLSRIIFGSQISLSIGLLGVFLSLVFGLLIGGISGLFGGITDMIIQRGIEILVSIPRIPLWMALSAALPQNWSPIKIYFAIIILLSLVGWTGVARVVRGKFLSLRDEDFVQAARAMGASNVWIILRHLIPNFISYVLVRVTLSIPGMILGETALSFLGIGLRPPVVSWGVLLQQAQNMRTVSMYPWVLLPGVFVVVAVLSFNFIGDGLRDAADPYSA